MALPLLIAGAALAGKKAWDASKAANKQNAFLDAADKAEQERALKAAQLFEAPQIHGAEQRKTFGNLFGLGFLSNFGRNPETGAFRSPQFEAMVNDQWKYRPIDTLMKGHPATVKGPTRPKSNPWTAALGGGLEGALSTYISAGAPGLKGGGAAGAGATSSGGTSFFGGGLPGGATPLNPSATFEGFKLKPWDPTNPFLNP